MNNLPQDLADAVKKEAELEYPYKAIGSGRVLIHPYEQKAFIAGATFLYSIQPTVRWVNGSERLPKETGSYYSKSESLGMMIIHLADLDDAQRYFSSKEWLEEELASPPKETEQTGPGKTDAQLIEEANAILRLAPPLETEQTAGMVQTVCEDHEYGQMDYSDSTGKKESYYACRKCGAMQPSLTEQPVVEGVKDLAKKILLKHYGRPNQPFTEVQTRLNKHILAAMEEMYYAAPQPPVSDAVDYSEVNAIIDKLRTIFTHNHKQGK